MLLNVCKHSLPVLGAVAALGVNCALSATPAEAAGFSLTWSGPPGSSATGTVEFDPAMVNNPGNNNFGNGFPDAFSITIAGDSIIGAGTFTLPDFVDVFLNLSSSVDFSQNLVGQAGFEDFNFFGVASDKPTGISPNTFVTNGGSGDTFTLISFTPDSTPIPSPAMLPGLIGAGMAMVRKKRKAEAEAEEVTT